MNDELDTNALIEQLLKDNGKYVVDQYGCSVPQKMYTEDEVKKMLYKIEMSGFFRAQKFYERRNED
jgi:hypothetical protein